MDHACPTPKVFYTHLSVLFALQPDYRRAAMFRDIKEHALWLNHSAHVHPVLLDPTPPNHSI